MNTINRNLDMKIRRLQMSDKSRVRRKTPCKQKKPPKNKNKTKEKKSNKQKSRKNEYDMKYNPNSLVCRPFH